MIRTDILDGTLDPGQKLRLESLRGSYPAGIGTLREILSRLTAERLVVAEGQKGFEVAPLSNSDREDIAALRRLLECHALEEAIGPAARNGSLGSLPPTMSLPTGRERCVRPAVNTFAAPRPTVPPSPCCGL